MGGLGGDDEQAVEAVASARRHGRKRRRFAQVLLVVSGIVLLLAALVWTQRRSIADNIVRRELEKRGVAARYRVAEIEFGRQRLVDVVLGDPRAPDLVADWIEVDTSVSLNGAQVTGARLGQARLRGTLRPDGTVSFGQIDRLLPPPSGKPFALPDFNVAVEDGRIRLATPYGLIGAKLAGQGNLADGFTGQLAAVSERLSHNGCGIDRLAANLSLRTATTGPSFSGPIRARMASCGDVRLAAPVIDVDARVSSAFDHWRGTARIAADRVAAPQTQVAGLAGTVAIDGSAQGTTGSVDLASQAFVLPQLAGDGLSIAGRYTVGGVPAFEGRVGARGSRLPAATLTRIAGVGDRAAGTPAP